MSATLITESLLREWRTRQLTAQRSIVSIYRPSPLPSSNPAPEEFAEFLHLAVRLITNHAFDAREDRRNFGLNGSSLYNYVAMEAQRLEIPQEELYPIASLVHPQTFINGVWVDLRTELFPGRLYVFNRPPSYMSRLSSLELSPARTPEFGHSIEEGEPITTPVLPTSWCDVPLLLTDWGGSGATWHKLSIFSPSDFASPEEAQAHIPNHQTRDFYARAMSEPSTPYMQVRRSNYCYINDLRPATVVETEAWFRNVLVGLSYQFTHINFTDFLQMRLSANARAMLADSATTRAIEAMPSRISPGVPTDVQPPPGSRPARVIGGRGQRVTSAALAASLGISQSAVEAATRAANRPTRRGVFEQAYLDPETVVADAYRVFSSGQQVAAENAGGSPIPEPTQMSALPAPTITTTPS